MNLGYFRSLFSFVPVVSESSGGEHLSCRVDFGTFASLAVCESCRYVSKKSILFPVIHSFCSTLFVFRARLSALAHTPTILATLLSPCTTQTRSFSRFAKTHTHTPVRSLSPLVLMNCGGYGFVDFLYFVVSVLLHCTSTVHAFHSVWALNYYRTDCIRRVSCSNQLSLHRC